jgi:hypothetical protein
MKDSDDVEARLSFLLGFIKTFVVHLTAKRALERYSFKNKGRVVTISHISVKRSLLHVPAGSWSKMKAMLSESFSSDPSDSESATQAIKYLEDTVTPSLDSDFKKFDSDCNKVVKSFKDIIQEKSVTLPGGMHCETVLATLGKYYKNCLDESDNPVLFSICKVLLIT